MVRTEAGQQVHTSSGARVAMPQTQGGSQVRTKAVAASISRCITVSRRTKGTCFRKARTKRSTVRAALRATELQRLGGGEELDGEHALHVVHHVPALEGRGGAHAHMVLPARCCCRWCPRCWACSAACWRSPGEAAV